MNRGKGTKACTARTSDTTDASGLRAAPRERERERELAGRQRVAKTRCTLSER